jgi:hypothetical protein
MREQPLVTLEAFFDLATNLFGFQHLRIPTPVTVTPTRKLPTIWDGDQKRPSVEAHLVRVGSETDLLACPLVDTSFVDSEDENCTGLDCAAFSTLEPTSDAGDNSSMSCIDDAEGLNGSLNVASE